MNIIENYWSSLNDQQRHKLSELEDIIKEFLPEETTTAIKYGLICYEYYGNLIYIGAFKEHVGFYMGSGHMDQFKPLLPEYETTKSCFHIKFDQAIPSKVILEIIELRVQENFQKYQLKSNKKNK